MSETPIYDRKKLDELWNRIGQPKEFVIYTGKKRAFEFHTILAIECCNTKEEMAEQYRATREVLYKVQEELYKVQEELYNCKRSKLYKLLKYLRLL